MSVEEMKLEAIERIAKLEDEQAIREILGQLEKLSQPQHQENEKNIDLVFEEAVAKYGSVLKKLAE